MDFLADGLFGRFVAGVVIGLLVYGLGKLNDAYWGY